MAWSIFSIILLPDTIRKKGSYSSSYGVEEGEGDSYFQILYNSYMDVKLKIGNHFLCL